MLLLYTSFQALSPLSAPLLVFCLLAQSLWHRAPPHKVPLRSPVVLVFRLRAPVVNSQTGPQSSTVTAFSSSASISSVASLSSTSIQPTATPQSPIPGVFPATDPSNPPSVQDTEVPDFAPAWSTAHQKAQAQIANYTLEELVTVVTGIDALDLVGRCVGNIADINDWPGLCLNDGPLGVRLADYITAFPPGINTASTFNRSLIRTRGLFMGTEFKGKGVNVALGPMMNMLRVPEAGRNFEGFGADPFLSGEAAYETVLGMQAGGVQACAKHFIDNEQETNRMTSSSDVDDRTQHEIYAQPFLRSVMAGVSAVMCSYNLINDTHACQNNLSMNGILKEEFGFQGHILYINLLRLKNTDWGATHSTLSATAGLDMTMPGGDTGVAGLNTFFGDTLVEFVNNGTIPLSRVQDMAQRVLASWYFLHQDSPSYPAVNFNANAPGDEATNEHINVEDDHFTVVLDIGRASIVLLKNVGNALPLVKPRSILLAGSDAGLALIGPNEFPNAVGDDGILAIGGGSGCPFTIFAFQPLEAIQIRARKDRTTVSWILDDFNLARAGNMAIGTSAALVFVNADSAEGSDRTNLTTHDDAEQLILAVAAQNNNTIVVTHSVGPLIVDSWIEHPNITGVLWAGVSSSETGNAITDVLYGAFNPSGRLPYTIAKNITDYPAQVSTLLEIPYSEGLDIDYRWFDAKNITPRYEFGFGMSYTMFAYSDLSIEAVNDTDNAQADLISNWEAGNASPSGLGSSTALWLHRPAFQVSFNVQNTGGVAGGEIPQLYIQMPPSAGEPPSILRGFSDVFLEPGETQTVTIFLTRHALSIWDVVSQGWIKPQGTMTVQVGASSRDFRLTGVIPL
ncbi:family 3 glycoside hydrolase [Gymnopus androsaceus JB14]|uniref:beta-glucosidase n=1 Tax=Gymnopus androsaceus JB14 TaxID=1447944 RepID=A0A6A4I3W1_9AGAR|nr:family 3 glycoside hydrolase [Gymnopus androsaceus JB14]